MQARQKTKMLWAMTAIQVKKPYKAQKKEYHAGFIEKIKAQNKEQNQIQLCPYLVRNYLARYSNTTASLYYLLK